MYRRAARRKASKFLHRILALVFEARLETDKPLYNFLGSSILVGI